MTLSAPSFPPRRRAADVVQSHLQLRGAGEIEADIAHNYDPAVILIRNGRAHRGRQAVRELGAQLGRELPRARFHYRSLVVAGEVALLEWSAFSPRGMVRDGVDSFWIRNWLIVAQTVHYTLVPFRKPRESRRRALARAPVL